MGVVEGSSKDEWRTTTAGPVRVNFTLYLITDRNQVPGGRIVETVECALKGGVRCVQLREKDLGGRGLFELAMELRKLTASYGARLVVNDRVDIAMAVEGDGVHLGQGSIGPGDARRLLGCNKLIGVSTHSLEEARRARDEGADFVTLGPVFHTPSKARYGRPIGIETVREVKAGVDIPVFALGGIDKEKVREIMDAGADGVALISAIMASPDPQRKAGEMVCVVEGYVG